MASPDIHGLLGAWLATSHARRAPAEARPGPHSPDLQGPLPGQPLLHSVQLPPPRSRGRAGPCLSTRGLAPARCPGPSAVGLSQGPPRPILRLQSPPLEAISSPKGPPHPLREGPYRTSAPSLQSPSQWHSLRHHMCDPSVPPRAWVPPYAQSPVPGPPKGPRDRRMHGQVGSLLRLHTQPHPYMAAPAHARAAPQSQSEERS